MYFTKPLVKTILEHPLNYKWSLQGLGMLRLYLSDEVRMHIWDDRYRIANVSPIHTHPWNFLSTVVAGAVKNIRYVQGKGEVYNRFSINCGAGARVSSFATVRLERQAPEFYGEGQCYYERYDEIHESRPLNGTVTLVNRIFRENRDAAFVYDKDGMFTSAEPRPASTSEILDITESALDKWFEIPSVSRFPSASGELFINGQSYDAQKFGTSWGTLENWGRK